MCAVCMEPVLTTSHPFDSSQKAAGSSMVPFGMYVGDRADGHIACLDCLTGYITTKLNDKMEVAFPINCIEVSPPTRPVARC